MASYARDGPPSALRRRARVAASVGAGPRLFVVCVASDGVDLASPHDNAGSQQAKLVHTSTYTSPVSTEWAANHASTSSAGSSARRTRRLSQRPTRSAVGEFGGATSINQKLGIFNPANAPLVAAGSSLAAEPASAEPVSRPRRRTSSRSSNGVSKLRGHEEEHSRWRSGVVYSSDPRRLGA